MGFLEIAADRHRFGEIRAVIQLQHRHPAHRVAGDEIRVEILRFAQIDFNRLDLNTLFSEKYVHAPRVGRNLAGIEFHGLIPSSE